VIAVGSGQALEMGAAVTPMSSSRMRRTPNGSSPTQATSSVALVMHNDFLIVGPPGDPAGLRGMNDAVAALRRIAERAQPSFRAATGLEPTRWS